MADATNEPGAGEQGSGLRSAAFSDSLDALGVTARFLPSTVRPLVPTWQCEGPAATIRFVPDESAYAAPYDEVIAFIDGLDAGSVIVIEAAGTDRNAHWGELFSAAAQSRGASGVVCDGAIRARRRRAGDAI